MTLATSSITYYMVKFRPGISHFTYVSLDLISSIAAVESCMMMIASLVPNFMMGVIIGSGYIVRTVNFRKFVRAPAFMSKHFISDYNHK